TTYDPTIAITSSRKAIGKSLPPVAFTSRVRNSYPSNVPATAPMTPTIAPPTRLSLLAHNAAPHKAPVTILPENPIAAFRLGVFGSLSAINSPIASRLTMYGVAVAPKNESHVPCTFTLPNDAAQLTRASGVNDRYPERRPARNANA